jgi:hypothetical protein
MIDYSVGSGNVDLSCVEIGPSLPLGDFTSLEHWQPERIGVLALYCSDGRWGEAFDEFCHKHLQIPRYDRWALPGGPAWLVPPPGGEVSAAVREQLDFLVQVHELDQIVLITHYGCAYYGQRLQRSPQDCLATQINDIWTAAALLRSWYPDVHVVTYLAMRMGNCLSFHRLDEEVLGGTGGSST